MATTGLFVFSLLFLCQALGQNIEPSDPEFASVFCRTDNALEPHPDPCKDDRFVMCYQGAPVAVMRCTPPLVFNSTIGNCTRKPQRYTKPAHCGEPQTCEDVNYDGSYIGGLDCSYFIVCVQGEPVIRCPPGSYFKHGIQNCAWPGFGQITNAEIDDCRRRGDSVRTTTTTTTTTTTATTTRATTNPCQRTFNGNAPDPSSCSRYYTCSSGVVSRLNYCPEGTQFDTTRGICNWPILVQCDSGP